MQEPSIQKEASREEDFDMTKSIANPGQSAVNFKKDPKLEESRTSRYLRPHNDRLGESHSFLAEGQQMQAGRTHRSGKSGKK